MRLVISADASAPRFEGVQLLAAARRAGSEAVLFDHPASRDPTLELPTLVRVHRAERVLLVSPAREDPATLAVLRDLGARVAVWMGAGGAEDPPWLDARRRWIAGAADRTFVTQESMASEFVDRAGRRAVVIAPACDPESLGIVDQPPRRGELGPGQPSAFVSVRGSDDPLRMSGPCSPRELIAYGDAPAFPSSLRASPLRDPKEWAAVLKGRAYLDGSHQRGGTPGVFSARSAAAAAGVATHGLALGARLSDAESLTVDVVTFDESLRLIAERTAD